MKILLTIILVTGHLFSFGQERIQYEQIDVNHKEYDHEIIDSLILFESYELDGLTFLVGQPSLNSASWKLLIKRNNKIIGLINGFDDSYYFKLSFFKTSRQSDPLLVFGESASEFYWGQKIIKIENDIVEDFGELNVGHLTSIDEYESIIKHLDIKRNEDIISIDFKCNDLIVDPETKNERRIKLATELGYIIQGDRILEVGSKNR